MYKKFVLGKSANAHVKNVLEQGNQLSQSLLETLDIDRGTVSTFMPEETPSAKLELFDCGGVANRTVTLAFISEFMHAYLQASENHCLIFEEFLASLTDPWLKVENPSYVHIGKELNYFLSGKSTSLGEIEKHVKIADAHCFAVAMTVLPKAGHPKLRSEVAAKFFKEAAENICFIAVNAYDEEGFLIWKREN